MAKRYKFSQTARDFVAQRAQGICEYCQMPQDFVPDAYELEHIIPLVQNGTNELENIAYSCGGCNGRKRAKMTAIDPITLEIVRLYHPRNDNWEEHFQWRENFSIIEGISPIGRATVDALLLNRLGCVNLRTVLTPFGQHPPMR
ncbi:MAG: hypothetical protein RL329_3425 [Bacteroidota bacterium]|jgi:hypothetical protein